MVTAQPRLVLTVERVHAQEVERRREIVGVSDDSLVAGEREPQVDAMRHEEPREVGPDAGNSGASGWSAMASSMMAEPRDLAPVVGRRRWRRSYGAPGEG
jgi:hypothetical protein